MIVSVQQNIHSNVSAIRNWHIIYIKEKKALKFASLLTSKHIENFCPVNVHHPETYIRTRMITKPLFPNYVFAQLNQEEMELISKNSNVINLVFWKNNPISVPNEYIKAIRAFTDNYNEIAVHKIDITEGSQSKVKRIINDDTIELMLPSIGYKLTTVRSKDQENNTFIRVRTIERKSAQTHES